MNLILKKTKKPSRRHLGYCSKDDLPWIIIEKKSTNIKHITRRTVLQLRAFQSRNTLKSWHLHIFFIFYSRLVLSGNWVQNNTKVFQNNRAIGPQKTSNDPANVLDSSSQSLVVQHQGPYSRTNYDRLWTGQLLVENWYWLIRI